MMTLYVIVIVRLKTELQNLVTDAKNAVTVIVIGRQDRYKSLLFLSICADYQNIPLFSLNLTGFDRNIRNLSTKP